MVRSVRVAVVAALLACGTRTAPAQADAWQAGFGLVGADGVVHAVAQLPGGVVAGGDIDVIGGAAVGNIARWDGAAWHPLGDPLNGTVRAVLEHEGTIYAAGDFTKANFANVAKIASTEPGEGGFDNPTNDRAARIGGYRWAKDMIGEFTKGVSEGWAQGMNGVRGPAGPVVDNSRSYSIQMQLPGVVDPTQAQSLKVLSRSLSVVDKQVEGARTIARRDR